LGGFLLALSLVSLVGCARQEVSETEDPAVIRVASTPATATTASGVPGKPGWDDGEILVDASECLKFVDEHLGTRAREIESCISSVKERLEAIRKQHTRFLENMGEVENFSNRFDTAKRRAEDEDRWPLIMGGHSFVQAKTFVVQERLHDYLGQRRPLVEAYRDRIDKDQKMIQRLQGEREGIPALLESFRLQHEIVSVTPSLEGLSKLRKTCIEVFHRCEAAHQEDRERGSPNPGPRNSDDPDILPLEILIK
jgi:hypothetical protein